MQVQHFHERHKVNRRYLRVKIVTNKDLNFITTIRPESTVTDLANRALNVFLQLTEDNIASKKQLTIAAVKQGRFFMPRSEIVSNLVSQDQEVEVIIVKAKPKFPKQPIPSQHDFEYLSKYLKPFEGLRMKPKKSSTHIQQIETQKKAHKIIYKDHQLSESNSQSQQQAQLPQIQHKPLSKKERKRQKKQNKEKIQQQQQQSQNQNQNQSQKPQQIDIEQKVQKSSLERSIVDKSIQKQEKQQLKDQKKIIIQQQQQQQQQLQSIIKNQSLQNTFQKKSSEIQQLQIAENKTQKLIVTQQKDNSQLSSQNNNNKNLIHSPTHVINLNNNQAQQSQLSIQLDKSQVLLLNSNTKDKVKNINNNINANANGKTHLHLQQHQQFQTRKLIKFQKPSYRENSPLQQNMVPRKISADNRSEKSDSNPNNRINSIRSPTVTFHQRSGSPKIIYVPESKNITQLKFNLEKEKEKLGIKSPMIKPKNCPSPRMQIKQASTGDQQQQFQSKRAKSDEKQSKNSQQHSPHISSSENSLIVSERDNPAVADRSPKVMRMTKSAPAPVSNKSPLQKTVDKPPENQKTHIINGSNGNIYGNHQIHHHQPQQQLYKKTPPPPTPLQQSHQIIEQESDSSQQQLIIINDNAKKPQNGVSSLQLIEDSSQQTIKKQPLNHNINNRFYAIDLKINQFKLQQSEEEDEKQMNQQNEMK